MNNLSHIIVSNKGDEASIADEDWEGPQPTDEQILLSELKRWSMNVSYSSKVNSVLHCNGCIVLDRRSYSVF